MAKTYDTYKDSGIAWIGEIPGEWRVEKARHIFTQRNSKGNKTPILLSATQINGMYPQHLLEGVVQVQKSTDLQTFKTVHKNDYVISLRSFQGGFEMSDYEGVCSPAYQVFYNKIDICHQYYKLLFKSQGFISMINSLVVGIREGKNIQYGSFSYSYLPFPPLSVQQSISSFLDTKCGEIDSLISIQEEMISELLAYKQSVITEAVTKGLDKKAKMKNSGVEWIGDIPEEWEIKPYKAIFYTEKGLNITKADLVEKGEPVLSYGQIHSKMNTGTKINDALLKYVPSSYIETNPECLVQKGCFLIADTSEDYDGCGNAIYVDKDMTLFAGYHTIVARPIHNNGDYKYLAYLFLTDIWRQQIRSRVSGIKVYSINQKIIRLTSVLLPPLPVQQAIATYLDEKTSQIDSLIALKQSKIESLKEYKKSIIYEYVTGKKRV
ncbi:restriction modification system DNA specificity domain protein [Prevotella sp. CAG:1092]|nr:restriction modification system DNA specificity domain protein [Prevotella sp. CAG:1092]